MPTPTYGPARARRVALRCSEEQYATYLEAARDDDRKLNAWILRMLDAAIQQENRGSEKSTRAARKRSR